MCVHFVWSHCADARSHGKLLEKCEAELILRKCEFSGDTKAALPKFLDPVLMTFLDQAGDQKVHRKELLAAQIKAEEYAEEAHVDRPHDWPTMLEALCWGLDSFLPTLSSGRAGAAMSSSSGTPRVSALMAR